MRAWLPDDPYPLAEVEDWPDPDAGRRATRTLLAAPWRGCAACLALAAEAGDAAAPATIELSDDPVLAGYQAVGGRARSGRSTSSASSSRRRPDDRVALLADAPRATPSEVLELRLGGAWRGE